MAPAEQAVTPIIDHPNRDKTSSRTSRVVVVILLIVSAVLIGIVTFGGWDVLEGMKFISIAWIVFYLVFAFYVLRWNRGVLPVIAALAVVMLIFAAIAVPSWFDRDAAAYAQPAIDSDVLGTVCAILVPVQALLVLAAMQGFSQAWNVEVERWSGDGPEPLATAGA